MPAYDIVDACIASTRNYVHVSSCPQAVPYVAT